MRRTSEGGPQVVTLHGEEVVVVVPAEQYRRITGHGDDEIMDFKVFLMGAPKGLEHIIPERSKELPRDVEP